MGIKRKEIKVDTIKEIAEILESLTGIVQNLSEAAFAILSSLVNIRQINRANEKRRRH